MRSIKVVAAVIIHDRKVFATQRGYGDFKGGWEFPGGKVEPGETPEQALAREIREELGVEIEVGDRLAAVEYDYPDFHLSMDCFWCTVRSGKLILKEHEAARWLTKDTLNSVDWLPADRSVIGKVRECLSGESRQEIKKFMIKGEAAVDIMQAIEERHSVRAYTTQKIEEEKRQSLQAVVDACNAEGGLNIFIRYDDPQGFDSRMAHYGSFRNVFNYIVLAGPKDRDISEACGYYGERIVLEAQMMGLNTCWVALTFNKKMVQSLIPEGQQLCMVIALGYGEDQGVAHKGKSLDQLVVTKGAMPDWFRKGAEAAMLAPTAVNQQKFRMGVKDGKPVIKIAGKGFYTKTDLGIVKYHFEAASGRRVAAE